MKRGLSLLLAISLMSARSWAQDASPSPASEAVSTASAGQPGAASGSPAAVMPSPSPVKRSLFGRILHPFGGSGEKSEAPPKLKDPKLRGLALTMQVSPQIVKLSEVRLLDIHATLINKGKKAIDLNFGTDQRIEIYLMNAGNVVLTKWSDNHAVTDKPATVLINPQEHIEYNEKISTRELTRDKVFVAEVFFPQYPELRVRQKFMTAP
jgi:Intracellular proteinase inhibitor